MTKDALLIQFAEARGLVCPSEVAEWGITTEHFKRALERGDLERVARGLYRHPESSITEHHDVAIVAAKIPHGVICLLSALSFHGLGTQIPHVVWVAISRKAGSPRVPGTRLVRMSHESLRTGVEVHQIEGIPVQVTSPAKTVADCFKFRNRIGLAVAIEALKDYRRNRRGSIDDVWNAARVNRVANVIRPYLEMLE